MLIGALERDGMRPEQRRTFDAIASGPRGEVPSPFLAMLDAPDLALAIQNVGSTIRFSGALSDELREIAILAAAAAFGSGYEWRYHLRIARELGVPVATIEAARTGETRGEGAVIAAIVALCRAAILERRIPQDSLGIVVARLGRQAATELVAIAGYYPLLALFLAAGEMDQEPVAPL